MSKPMMKIGSLMAVLLLFLAVAPLAAPQTAQAHESFYFKTPDQSAVYKVGDTVPVSFYAGVCITQTQFDAWGRPSYTTYTPVKAQFKVFKGNKELYSEDFTYESGTTLETNYVPNTSGTLTLKIYGPYGLNSDATMQYDSRTIKVKAKKPSEVTSIKPKITVDRVDKKVVEIICLNDMGYGMKIYRANKLHGPYKLLKTTKKNMYTDKKVSAKKVYYYKVFLYAKSGSKVYKSKWSKPQKAGKFTARVKIVQKGSNSAKITWMKIKGAGYYLVCRNNKGDKYAYDVISCEGDKTFSYIDKGLEKGKTYYYMIIGGVGDDDVAGKYHSDKYKVKIK